MRFAELAQIYAKKGKNHVPLHVQLDKKEINCISVLLNPIGCKVLVYPGAFNMTTGPAHWELLVRAR